MKPYSFIKHTFLLVALLWLFIAAGCNNSNSEGGSSSSITELLGIKELPQAKTDSLFLHTYVSKMPAFKEYEDLMQLFYRERGYELAWFKNNKLVPQTEKLLSTIDNSTKEGLDPKKYKLVDFNSLFKQYEGLNANDSTRLKLQEQIDVALTATYFNYASDFYRGQINPQQVGSVDWNVRYNKIKLHKVLQTILEERESTYPYYEFEALHNGYVRLRDALGKYREIEQKGGWPKVELGNKKSLKKGDSAQAVLTLRKRLNPEQALDTTDARLLVYDEELERQVKKFQQLHGLKEDGVVGGTTLKTMNVPVEDRIDQIIINMERWRWIPKRMVPKKYDQKFIWVNIPEYKLYIYEDPDNDPEAEREYKKAMEMRVIVGKTMNSTPIFSDLLEYVVMAPYWNVPASIVENEIKPAMLRNSDWLASQDMEIVTKDKANRQISPYSIDWGNVTAQNFPYLIRQRPGPKNSLGSIKFLFPNQYSVYLHDTPANALFNQTERNFSHGCVRVEKPMELAKYLLSNMPEWDESRIRSTINGGEETWVTLPNKVQVYIVYFTSWVDEEGNIHFREDLYGHDKKLEQQYFG